MRASHDIQKNSERSRPDFLFLSFRASKAQPGIQKVSKNTGCRIKFGMTILKPKEIFQSSQIIPMQTKIRYFQVLIDSNFCGNDNKISYANLLKHNVRQR
jgi:hypothetical protein